MTYNKNSTWGKKYIVTKADGTSVDPDAEYLVLRLDTDPSARFAAAMWASWIEDDAPQLANEILERIKYYAQRDAE